MFKCQMVRRLISGFTLDLSLNHGDNAKVENPLKKARKYIVNIFVNRTYIL